MERYATRTVLNSVSPLIQNELWNLFEEGVENGIDTDAVHSFALSSHADAQEIIYCVDGKKMNRITIDTVQKVDGRYIILELDGGFYLCHSDDVESAPPHRKVNGRSCIHA